MRRRVALLLTLTFVLSWAFPRPAGADTWLLPEKQKYYSANKEFYLEVTPKRSENQIRQFENAGARKGVRENVARATIYARGAGGGYLKRQEFRLVNEVSPVSALVSDDGAYVVTFDDWYSVGHGDNVVVIYRSDGTLVKKFGLEDLLTPGDIEKLPRTTSSIWWGGTQYFDEAKGLLVLKAVSKERGSAAEATYYELKIELATGRLLEPKRDLFPQQD